MRTIQTAPRLLRRRKLAFALLFQILVLAGEVMAQSGTEVWHHTFPGCSIVGVAASPDGTLHITANTNTISYTGTNNGLVVALGLDGSMHWVTAFSELIAGPPTIGSEGTVYCTRAKSLITGLGYIGALSTNGESLWQISGTSTFQPPVIQPGGDLFLVNEGTASIVKPDGTVRWTADPVAAMTTPATSAPPVLASDMGIWLGTSGGVQFYTADGRRIWRNDSPGSAPIGMAPAGSNGVYTATRKGLFAFGSDGSELWRVANTNFSSGPVLALDGTIYIGTSTNAFVALDPNGNQIWGTPVDGAISTTAAVGADGGIFFGTAAGTVYALNSDGSVRWSFAAGSSIASAPLLAGGLALFGSADGTVWALRADTGLAATPWPKYQRDNQNQGRTDYALAQPGAVANLAAQVQSPGGTVIHLTWQSAPNAWTYEVWRAVVDDFSQATLMASNINGSLKFDDDLTRADITYSYWVRGVNPVGVGDISVPVKATQTNQFWAVTLGDFGLTPVVATNGNVYVSAWKGTNYFLAGFDPNGTELWRFQHTNRLWNLAMSPNGNLIVQSFASSSAVLALTPVGQLAWSLRLTDLDMHSAAIDRDGTAYFLQQLTSSSAAIAAISADGVLLWNRGLSGTPAEHATISTDGTIRAATSSALYAKNPDASLRWAFEPSSPQWRWEIPTFNAAGETVAVTYRVSTPYLFRIGPDSTIVASNKVSGLSWDNFRKREPLVAANGNSFLVGTRALMCFDPNGGVLWTNNFQTSLDFPFLVPALDSAGNIYVPGPRTILIIGQDGSNVSKLELADAPVDTLALTEEGRIYISVKGKLHAMRALAGLDTRAPWPMYRHDPSGSSCAQKQPVAPNPPVLRPTTPFANRVRIQCEATGILASLEIFRSTTTNLQDAVLVGQGRFGQLFADDTTAVPGTVYYYWARLRNAGGAGDFSGPVSQTSISVPVKWLSSVPKLGPVVPAISPDGSIYVCATNTLVALNEDGSTRWQLSGYNGSPMVGPDGAVIIRSGDRVASLTREGTTNWVVAGVSAYVKLNPAVDPAGNVIIPYTGDTILQIAANGSNVWQRTYTNSNVGLPSIAQDGTRVFINSLYATRLNPDGAEVNSVVTASPLDSTTTPVLDSAATLYLPDSSQRNLIATRPDGSNQWNLASSKEVQTAPVVGEDGTVFVGYSVTTSPMFGPHWTQVAAVLPDGSLRWKFPTEQTAWPALAVSANQTLIVGVGTNLYALACDTGKVIWQMPSPNDRPFGTPVLDCDGTLYVPVAEGLLALRSGSGPATSAWPMFRQNARQTACMQRAPAPLIRTVPVPVGSASLEVTAPSGGVILQSPDLRGWTRMGFQPATNAPTLWPINPGTEQQMFFRAVSP